MFVGQNESTIDDSSFKLQTMTSIYSGAGGGKASVVAVSLGYKNDERYTLYFESMAESSLDVCLDEHSFQCYQQAFHLGKLLCNNRRVWIIHRRAEDCYYED